MLQLSFKQTKEEMMVRAASTLLFGSLKRSGCRVVPLSKITEHPQYGFTASASPVPVGPKLVRITDLQAGNIDWESVPYCKCDDPENYLLKYGDILFARTGATTGKTHLMRDKEDAVFASYLIRLRANGHVTPEYLYSFFQGDLYWSQIVEEKEGSAQPNVNGRKLWDVELPLADPAIQSAVSNFIEAVRARQHGSTAELPILPEPIADQRRIVARIEELSAKINEACTMRLEAESRNEKLPICARNEIFLRMSESLHAVRLDSVADSRLGKMLSGNQAQDGGGTPYLRNANVQWDRFDLNSVYRMNVTSEDREELRLQPGDILVCEGGDIGKSAMWNNEIPGCIYQKALHRIRVDRDRLVPRFLLHHIFWAAEQGHFTEIKTQTTIAHLTGVKLKAYSVYVPPLPEQRRIVEYLDDLQAKVDAVKKLQEETAEELNALMPSILSKAFAEEL